jgi:hypothetical protein
MSLDVNSEKGKESVKQEQFMLNFIADKWKMNIIQTKKNDSAKCDGFLYRKNILVGLFESKCRNISITELENWGSWLVTNEKIQACRLLSEYLCIPFLGFLYLLKDNLIMYWKITDKNGLFLFNFKIEETKTQKTINGGEIIRPNAFLPYEQGKFFQ